MTALAIRPMDRAGLALGIEWAAAEGWNPGLHDADAFHAADPGGFLLGTLGDEPVGMIAAVRHGTDFGFVGFYIVRPGFRGRGLGLALWRAGMARLEGRAVGLDGVVAQQANYRKSGFATLHANARYEGRTLDRRADPAAVPAGSTVQLDVPVPNADAVALARSQGMAPVFETARMVRGTAPAVEMAGQFGVTSFELG
jgi:ribosomal protein S18 acetylase RimI-like enzyme